VRCSSNTTCAYGYAYRMCCLDRRTGGHRPVTVRLPSGCPGGHCLVHPAVTTSHPRFPAPLRDWPRAFEMIFFTGYYRIAQSVASVVTLVVGIGALAGVYLGGRTADELSARGRVNARIVVPAVSLLGVVVVCTPAAGALSLTAMRTYPRDVPTAAQSYRRQPMTEAG
jgi:hypothetical protein